MQQQRAGDGEVEQRQRHLSPLRRDLPLLLSLLLRLAAVVEAITVVVVVVGLFLEQGKVDVPEAGVARAALGEDGG